MSPQPNDRGPANANPEHVTCGLPVVATDIPGNREALGDSADAQLFAPGDVESLASRLGLLIRDGELRSSLATGNRERATSEFTIERMCGAATTVLEGLLLAASGRGTHRNR